MTLRPCRRAPVVEPLSPSPCRRAPIAGPLSSPPRLSIVCFNQIVGLPSHAALWYRFAIQSGEGNSGHQESRRHNAKNGPHLECLCSLTIFLVELTSRPPGSV